MTHIRSRKPIIVVILTLAIYYLSVASSAVADEPSAQCVSALGSNIGCAGQTISIVPAAPGSSRAQSSPGVKPVQGNALTIPVLSAPNGSASQTICVGFRTQPQQAPPAPDLLAAVRGLTTAWSLQYGLCSSARANLPPTLAVNPAVLAASFWETIPLPAPEPTIPPGYAITGKPAYLVTNGTLDPAPYHQQTIVGPLEITAHGVYQVNWGDGATGGPYQTEGHPWPDGKIAHTYDTIGAYNVTVTETWTATWHLGTAGGTLTDLATHATIPRFPVRQLQAVITG